MQNNTNIIVNMKKILLCFVYFVVSACGPKADERYDTGYSDGYAEGHNTACKIRATLVEGDWENPGYSRGYRDGQFASAAACRAEK